MKTRFLDLDTRTTFDGSAPYVFYFGEGCSTGKWYSKTVLLLTDCSEINVSTDRESLFLLANMAALEGQQSYMVEMNAHSYIDIEAISSHSIDSVGELVHTSSGTAYLHQIPMLFMSDSEGEFHDSFKVEISRQGSEAVEETYLVGADVYMEDERLQIDLANEGVEIPEAFQRAVYTSNVRDESSDKILLNRKWKELLIEYWNTVANKGSYNSLVNSLKFFEYGDLVKIEEYWKQKDNFGIEEMIPRDLQQILDPLVREYLDVMVKTTYIGLYLSLNKPGEKDSGEILYRHNLSVSSPNPNRFLSEPVPELVDAAVRLSVEDLELKMTLLGNFFSSYFMPIHLDLLQSTVGKTVFTNSIKILTGVRFRTESWYDSLEPISCSLNTQSEFWIGNTRAFNYPDTVLRNYTKPAFWGDSSFIGIDTEIDKEADFSDSGEGLENAKIYLNQYFGGTGVAVPVECVFNNVEDFIKSIRLSIYRNTEDCTYELDRTYMSEMVYRPNSIDGKSLVLDFDLLFRTAGHYCVMLQATEADGSDFAGSWYIDIHGSIGDHVDVKRLKKIDFRNDIEECDDWFYRNTDFNDFMFTEPMESQIRYKQWLSPTDGSESEGIGMNHMVMVDCGTGGGGDIRDIEMYRTIDGKKILKQFDFTIGDPDNPEIIRQLSIEYPHYWWRLLQRRLLSRSGGKISELEDRYYIAGVRKVFDTDEPLDRELVSKKYYFYRNGEEEVEVINVRYSASRNPLGRGFLIITAPEGSEVWLDGAPHMNTVQHTTTLPVRKERSILHIRSLIENHMFSCDVPVSDMNTVEGQESYKVHPVKSTGYSTIDTSRFFPIFHRLEEADPTNVSREDTVVLIPQFDWVDRPVSDAWWTFTNKTTGEVIESKSFRDGPLYIQQPFVGKYDYSGKLSRGYYDVELHFKAGGTENVQTVFSAFRIV